MLLLPLVVLVGNDVVQSLLNLLQALSNRVESALLGSIFRHLLGDTSTAAVLVFLLVEFIGSWGEFVGEDQLNADLSLTSSVELAGATEAELVVASFVSLIAEQFAVDSNLCEDFPFIRVKQNHLDSLVFE